MVSASAAGISPMWLPSLQRAGPGLDTWEESQERGEGCARPLELGLRAGILPPLPHSIGKASHLTSPCSKAGERLYFLRRGFGSDTAQGHGDREKNNGDPLEAIHHTPRCLPSLVRHFVGTEWRGGNAPLSSRGFQAVGSGMRRDVSLVQRRPHPPCKITSKGPCLFISVHFHQGLANLFFRGPCSEYLRHPCYSYSPWPLWCGSIHRRGLPRFPQCGLDWPQSADS